MARLARLQLSDEEVEPMAKELSAVLDHIATIAQLDLEGVAPMTHVVADAMPTDAIPTRPGLRADEPVESLPPAVSGDGEGFSVPSPQA